MTPWGRVAARRRRRRRDDESMRRLAELRMLVERARREQFRAEADRLFGELRSSDAWRAGMAIVDYGVRASRDAS